MIIHFIYVVQLDNSGVLLAVYTVMYNIQIRCFQLNVYVYTCTYPYSFMNIHIHTRVHKYIFSYLQIYTTTHVCIHSHKYTCIYISMPTFLVYSYTSVHTQTSDGIHAHTTDMYTYVCISTCLSIYYIHTCIDIHRYAYTYVYVRTYLHTYRYSYTLIYVHIHIIANVHTNA